MIPVGTIAAQTGAWNCLACGKCTPSCPLAQVGKDHAPRRMVASTLAARTPEGDALLAGCLACGACEVHCPEGVKMAEFVRGARGLLPSEARPVPPHHEVLRHMARRMAAFAEGRRSHDWLEPDLKVGEKGKVAIFVGCLPIFDVLYADLGVRTVEIVRSAVRLLNRLGIAPALLADERCCGHDLLWAGDRDAFEALARRNARALEASGAETVVTACAECARTLALDVPKVVPGFKLKVQHMAEFLAPRKAELGLGGGSGGNGAGANGEAEIVTYQDPCRLGRHRGVYEAPRELIGAVAGVELREMDASGPDAGCCGTPGFVRCDAASKRIQVERLREARRTGAARMITACPKCLIHYACAQADERRRAGLSGCAASPGCTCDEKAGAAPRIEVQDLTEFLAAAVGAGAAAQKTTYEGQANGLAGGKR